MSVQRAFKILLLFIFSTVCVKTAMAFAIGDVLCAEEYSPAVSSLGGQVVVSGLQVAEHGGTCGGGGTIVQFPGQVTPFLLDRLTLNPSLANQKSNRGVFASLPRAKVAYPEIEVGTEEDHQIRLQALQLIWDWHSQLRNVQRPATILMEMIYWQIAGTPILRTGHRFKTIQRYHLSRNLLRKNPKLTTVVLFIPKKGLILSSPVWDTLVAETKVGLLVHESLRQLQLYYFFSDEQIQLLTSMLLDIQPNANTRFEPALPSLLRTVLDTAMTSPAAAKASLDVFKMINQVQFAEMQRLLQQDKDASSFVELLVTWKKMGILAD